MANAYGLLYMLYWQAEGSAGLLAWQAEQKERAKPEYLKQRPKYYYYYEWMRGRICDRHPALPEPVMDKLLTMDAGDLDLILQYSSATDNKVSVSELERGMQHFRASK